MSEYVFLIERDDRRCVALRNAGMWLPDEAETIVGDDLHPVEDQPGMWATFDGHTTVTRFAVVPVGTFPEDHVGVGVPVAGVAS